MSERIDGVTQRYLNKNVDERGWLMETYRQSWGDRERPVHTYISKNFPGVIRAWHYHKKQDDYWVVASGVVKAVLYDARPDSPTYGQVNEYYLGDDSPVELKIPKGVYHGYKTVGQIPSILINSPTEEYNPDKPDEFRVAYNDQSIPYDWGIKMT